jgi:hypothetical protein
MQDSTAAITDSEGAARRLYTQLLPPYLRATLLALCVVPASLWAADNGRAEQTSAASFLTFQSAADGRCQILSSGGQLRVLINNHANRAIDYRLVRIFGDGHRQGLVGGTASAGGEPVPLGCTQVDGRPQDWLLERARFTP